MEKVQRALEDAWAYQAFICEYIANLFIANGDIIRVDTAEKKYLGKDTSGE